MRVLLAAFCVIAGVFFLVALLSALGWLEGGRGTLLGGLVLGASFPVLVFLAYFLFHPREPDLAELERAGLIEAIQFRAIRAFGIEDYNDEGPHYIVELDDGSVLYFVGQYLYDYEPFDDELSDDELSDDELSDDEPSDDAEVKRLRHFPCSEFTLLRHKKEGHILDMKCSGSVIEPEIMASVKDPFYVLRRLLGHVPKDGELISLYGYDTLKQEIQEVARHK